MAAKITVDDKRYKQHRKALDALDNTVTYVGIVGTSNRNGDAIDNAALGYIHEVGAGVPRRSWLRDPATRMKDKIAQVFTNEIAAYLASGSTNPDSYLGRAGAWLAGQLQANISSGIPPANDAATVAAKGSSTPLINTGQLRAAITWAVRKVGL